MTSRTKYALASFAILAAFGAGRWFAPEHVKTVKEVVTVKEKQKVKIVERDVHRTTTITEYPDGHKTTVIEDNSTQKSDTDTSTKSGSHSTDTTEITRGTSKVTISALGGIPLSLDAVVPVWGASVTKPVLGPVTIGAWGLSNRTAGMSLGLTF